VSRAPEVVRETPRAGPVPHYDLEPWLARGVVAGITGRGTEPGRGFDLGLWSNAPVGEVMTRWRAFRRELPGFDSWVLGGQVHGTAVEAVGGGRGWTHIDGVDGWVTTASGVLLTVTIADCIPVYLLVPGRGVALLHAGWRGTAGGILGAGLDHLLAGTGSTPSSVVMHAGVGICGSCYEVGSEVMAGCGLPAEGPGPWHLDLRTHLVGQARRLGIGTVSVSAWCSGHDRPSFYSHRASGGSDGRMVAYLGMPHRIDSDSAGR
jgi:purine-nucleoside/S-methyl-5'-thioadenosine phosphorylase / adenosine deaminase